MSPINVSTRSKSVLTVVLCVILVLVAVVIFATTAYGAAKFITTPIGYAPPIEDLPITHGMPRMTWKVARIDPKLVHAIRTPPKPVVRALSVPTRLPSAGGDVWDRLAACESGGNWHNKKNPSYRGGVQFSWATWRAMGGSGDPADASKEEQLMRAKKLQAQSGWGQWPACSRKLGLR